MNKIKTMILLFFVVSLTTFSSNYKDELVSRMKTFEESIDYKNYTTADMINGSSQLYQCWDKELNIIYQKILIELDKENKPRAKQQLIIAQRAWITFRDANSHFHSFVFSSDGQGTITGPIRIGTAIGIVEDRTIELANLYDFMVEN